MNDKSRKTYKASGSRNIKAKNVVVLISSNTPITILNVLIIFIINLHLHFWFQGNNFDIEIICDIKPYKCFYKNEKDEKELQFEVISFL